MSGQQLQEHRRGTRINVDVAAQITTRDGWSGLATVRDASVSGAFIDTDMKLLALSRVCPATMSLLES